MIYAVIVAGSVAALSEIWGELQRAAGATERMVELIHAVDSVADPARPGAAAGAGAGRDRLRGRHLPLPVAAGDRGARRPDLAGRARRDRGAGRARRAPARPRSSSCCCASSTPTRAGSRSTASTSATWRAPTCAGSSRWCRRSRRSSPPSARENIRFGRPEASDAEVEAAARAAAAARVHRAAAAGLRHLGRRARRHALGRAEAAAGDRPRHPARRAGAAARRGDERARRRERARGADRRSRRWPAAGPR